MDTTSVVQALQDAAINLNPIDDIAKAQLLKACWQFIEAS
jgi:hypothetical protein